MDEKILISNKALFEKASYIFQIDKLVTHVERFKSRLNSNINLCYAMKANPFLVKVLDPYVSKFEVCSFGEFKICEALQIEMSKIILSGVSKSMEEIDYVVMNYGSSVTYTVESIRQWNLLNQAGKKHKKHLKVYLRLTSGNQFGMSKEDIARLWNDSFNQTVLEIVGIHYFVGTQRQTVSKYTRDFEKLNSFIETFAGTHSQSIALEYGPGLPIDYFVDESANEIAMVDALIEALEKQSETRETTIELGRYLAAHCGYYVTKVEDVKCNNGTNIAIVNGGIHQLNYFGQIMAMKSPFYSHLELGKVGRSGLWNICGSLCTTSDVLLKNQNLNDVKVGDLFVFENVGAYSVTEGISLFLSRDLPQIYFYTTRSGFELIRSTFETYKINMKEGR
ncbi:alanine racemase [Erysipelothrix aquatica]|uniref:alanine racemase n=1 Tax=Erysipelothrix aquatica TaxID=2683714 RepID=UPI001357A94B|nr:alanine racemase [Erysipelothrix aquatica]